MNKKLILSITIFCLVFVALGLPYIHWWFTGDDFHGIYLGYKTKNWTDLFYFFYDGNPNQDLGPSNFDHSPFRPSFFSVYFRPLYCVYLALQYWLFGTNAYPYLLCNVFFHAINTVILFNIFLYFIDLYPAFLVALTFAFHPQIAYRFGAIVNLHYYINVMLILLIMLLFKKYLDTKKLIYNILACIIFAFSLFTRETSIVLPAIIFLGTYLYTRSYGSTNSPRTDQIIIQLNSEQINSYNISKTLDHEPNKNTKHTDLFKKSPVRGEPVEPYKCNFITLFFHTLKQTFGIIFVGISFLTLRAFLYHIQFSQSTNPFKPLSWFKHKFPEFQVITYDFLGLSWLPWGHKIIRGIIVITLLSILLWLFVKNTKKIYVLYFLFSMALMLWPILFGGYCPRYFYEAQPFALMALIFLFKFYNGTLQPFKKIGLFLLTILIIFYIEFAIENFLRREHKMHQLSTATKELIKNPEIKNRALCFLGYPLDGCAQHNAEIFWILLNNPKHQIFFDSSTAMIQADSHIVQTTSWRNISSNYLSENYIKIEPVKSGFRFISLNQNKIFFTSNDEGCSVGKKIINKKIKVKNEEVVTDFTLLIEQQYLSQKPLFLTWDYVTKSFEPLLSPQNS